MIEILLNQNQRQLVTSQAISYSFLLLQFGFDLSEKLSIIAVI